MKKNLIFTAVLSLFFAVFITAQESGKKLFNMFEKRAERMAIELGLTDVEKAKVQTLLEKQTNEYKETKEKLSPKDASFKNQLETLHKKQESELEKLIGNDKYAKHLENRKREKQRIEAAKERQQTTGNGQ